MAPVLEKAATHPTQKATARDQGPGPPAAATGQASAFRSSATGLQVHDRREAICGCLRAAALSPRSHQGRAPSVLPKRHPRGSIGTTCRHHLPSIHRPMPSRRAGVGLSALLGCPRSCSRLAQGPHAGWHHSERSARFWFAMLHRANHVAEQRPPHRLRSPSCSRSSMLKRPDTPQTEDGRVGSNALRFPTGASRARPRSAPPPSSVLTWNTIRMTQPCAHPFSCSQFEHMPSLV